MPLAIALSPNGTLFTEDSPDSSPAPDEGVAERVRQVFAAGNAGGLIHLATVELQSVLPPTLSYWREFARTYLTRLCHRPGMRSGTGFESLDAPRGEFERILEAAPPMTGIEYLGIDILEALWGDLNAYLGREIRDYPGGVQGYLNSKNPVWHLVGRVTFHLAENRRDEECPFAFMATYTSTVSRSARPQYIPLGRAVDEYAGSRNRDALITLLSPVHRAANESAFVRELVDSGDIFTPLAWTPEEAYRFLENVPLLEASGVLVRVPASWLRGRPPRPTVSVTLGDKPPAKFGSAALLDFSTRLVLDGEPLTEEERQHILSSTGGLVLLKGKWVEIDRKKLSEVLRRFDLIGSANQSGVGFVEALRLLSGAAIGKNEEFLDLAETREWSRVAPGDWLQTVLGELRDPAALDDAAPVAEGLRAELRDYQKVGTNWLWFTFRLGVGACLADDMGLGKTVQVLALLLAVRRRREFAHSPSLVVVPASLVANWKAELEKFAPSLSALFIHPSELPPGRMTDLQRNASTEVADTDVVVTSYSMLLRVPWLSEIEWNIVVLDEAQAIKNPATRQARATKKLRAGHRIALTGTPVENRISDLWSLFDFLSPGLLGSATEFNRFLKSRAERKEGQYAPVRSIVRPYILRRLKTDKNVIADLPDKTEVRAYCGLTRVQTALYEQSVKELAHRLQESESAERRGVVLAFIQRFKQICNHPAQWLGNGEYDPEASGKFARLRTLCEVIVSRQQKVLIFTQFREITEPLNRFLQEVFRRPGLVFHGGTPVRQRSTLVREFQSDGGPPYIVVSLKAGGTGLNLTAASHVVHFDRWWNPAVENQATDRAYRIGQHKNVLVHKFVCRGTIEDKIDSLIEEKKDLAGEILSESGDKLLTEMSNEELLNFVALDLRLAATD